jgi:ACS family pantothenate transporter-like MFS transporter
MFEFVAFYFGGFSSMASPILHSCLNHTLASNYGKGGLIIPFTVTLE